MTNAVGWKRRASEDDATTHVLLVEPDPAQVPLISELLRAAWREPMTFTRAERVEDASQQLLAGTVTVVLLRSMTDEDALDHVRLTAPGVPVILLTDVYSPEAAMRALKAGAQDYVARADLTPAVLQRTLTHAIARKRSEAQLAHRALQDPLTGLPNRTLFMDRLGMALDRARRTGSVTGVLFLDVDDFKAINDSLGHAAGDRVLTALAGRLRSVLRPMDTVARFGGDEFTFLFEGLSSPREAVAIAERVRHAAVGPISVGERHEQLTVSIGVATTSEPETAPDELLARADAAMYQAKGHGGGAATVAGVQPDAAAGHQNGSLHPVVADELRAALERAELRVVYQPVFQFDDERRVSGFEALVRWQHPERGLIPPCDFIPLAAEIGLLPPIGEFVLGEALGLLARLLPSRNHLTASINVSHGQLGESHIRAAVAAVDAAGVHPGSVCLEIPERTVSEDPDTAIHAAEVLRTAGLRVAIDDYGTSSVPLSSLRRLKAHQLKIHESIVGALDDAATDGAVVGAVVDLGHALGMKVVAEGVETDEQLLGLRTLGCDGAQGYLLCRPMRADQLEELIVSAA